MSRAISRALLISTVGGIAVAPALAYGADNGPTAPAATVTVMTAPQHAQGGTDFTLSAKVLPDTKTASGGDEQPTEQNKRRHDPERTTRHGKHNTGKGKGKKKHHRRRHAETGTLTFTVDGKTLAPVPVSHDRASEKLKLPTGTHTVSAAYSGDDNYEASHSKTISFVVG